MADTGRNGAVDLMDARNDLWQSLSMALISAGVSGDSYDRLKSDMQILLDKYEITPRSTEIAVCSEDRNRAYIQKFLTAKAVAGRTAKTINCYKRGLEHIIPAIGKSVEEIEPDDIRLYLAVRLRKNKVSKVTLQNEWRILSSFFQWLTAEEIIRANPMLKVESVKARPEHEEPFSDIEVEKIRGCLRTNRERAIVETLLSTGCRVGELVQIQLSEIDGDKIIVHGKGEKDRLVYLNAKALMAIERYMAERKDNNPYLFCAGRKDMLLYAKNDSTDKLVASNWYTDPKYVGEGYISDSSIESLMRRIGKRAGVENVHPHRFRKTCATTALRRGMPIEKVSKMLGHATLDTTKIYISISEDEMKQAHEKYVV